MSAPDWVKARFECTASEVFKALIDTLRRDTTRFNGLSGTSPSARVFKPEHDNGVFRVFRGCYVMQGGKHILTKHHDHCHSANQRIQVELRDDTIIARRGDIWSLEINHVWNAESLRCDYMIDGAVVSLESLCQRILGDFLFDSKD